SRLGRSAGITQKMKMATHNGVVAFRMLASPLEIVRSPHAMATHGITALVMAMIANGIKRLLSRPPKSDLPDRAMIAPSATAPEADRMNTSTVGLMPWTPSLKKRNDRPQIRPSPMNAA